jgi:plasmid maintenance system killer protein
MMEITFRSIALRRFYENEVTAIRQWGPVVGRKYIQRVTVLMAAENFTDLFQIRALRLHALEGHREGQYAITVHERWRLILVYDEAKETLFVEEVSRHYGD